MHEPHNERLNLVSQLLFLIIKGEVPETRQIHHLHINTEWGLESYVHGIISYVGAEGLMRVPNDMHHVQERPMCPLVCLGVNDVPFTPLLVRDVTELQNRRSTGSQCTRDKIKLFTGESLYKSTLADRLLSDENELGQREVDGTNFILDFRFYLRQHVEKLCPMNLIV